MPKKCLLCILILMLFCACSSTKEPPNGTSQSPSFPSSDTPVSSAEISPAPSSSPGASNAPESAPSLPAIDLDAGLGIIDGITFHYPHADADGRLHIALYQSYSAIALTIPAGEDPLIDPDYLQGLIETNNGICNTYDSLPDMRIALLSVDDYNGLLATFTSRFEGAFQPLLEGLRDQDDASYIEAFEVDEYDYLAVSILTINNRVASLSVEETAFIHQLAAACLDYQELRGLGADCSIAIHYRDAKTGEDYEVQSYTGIDEQPS